MKSVFVGIKTDGSVRTTCLDVGNEAFTLQLIREWCAEGLKIEHWSWEKWQEKCGHDSITIQG